MRFSKTATAVIAMIAMIAPTAACGTDNASSDGKTEITVWAWDNNLKANAKPVSYTHLTLPTKA